MKTFAAITLLFLDSACMTLPSANAQTPDQIQAAIERGAEHLRQSAESSVSREIGLVAYALMKAGEPADSPAVQKLVGRIIDEKFKDGHYLAPTGITYQFYEGGCDLMALTEANPKKYASQIDEIANLLLSNQNPNGGWYYMGRHDPDSEGGDTSVTQYAVLGLWAAHRAGASIPKLVWGQLALWQLETQDPDGGFSYHPGGSRASTHSMTVNGVSSLCIARLFLFPKGDYTLVLEDSDVADDGATSTPKSTPMSSRA